MWMGTADDDVVWLKTIGSGIDQFKCWEDAAPCTCEPYFQEMSAVDAQGTQRTRKMRMQSNRCVGMGMHEGVSAALSVGAPKICLWVCWQARLWMCLWMCLWVCLWQSRTWRPAVCPSGLSLMGGDCGQEASNPNAKNCGKLRCRNQTSQSLKQQQFCTGDTQGTNNHARWTSKRQLQKNCRTLRKLQNCEKLRTSIPPHL